MPHFSQMNKKDLMAKIHGYIASDGGIYNMRVKDIHGKKLRIRRKLRTKFFNQDKELIDDFINIIHMLYPKIKSIRYYPKRYEVEVRNNTISKDILKLGKVWSSNWEFPKSLNDKQKKLWIAAFTDCDGTVQNRNYDRFVAIDSINKNGLRRISRVLEDFGITNKIYNIKGGSFRLKIFRRENLIKFNSLIKLNHLGKRRKLIEAINSYK